MDQALQNLNRFPGAFLLTLAVVTLLLASLSVYQAVVLKGLRKRWSSLMSGTSGENLEAALERHMAERQSIQEGLGDAQERLTALERKMRTAKRYAGLVRYDAFEDVGGSQSFAFALYDEEGNGAVITSQVGREGCRVYGKTLVNGKAERLLSKEEEMAIEEASSIRTRPRISP